MSNYSRFRGPFEEQHGKRAQTLLKYASQHLLDTYWSLSRQLSWKKCLLLTCQVLGLLVNTLAADDKYLLINRDKLKIPIQMILSQKQKNLSQVFSAFLKSRLNFENLLKKDDPHRFCISENKESENVVR